MFTIRDIEIILRGCVFLSIYLEEVHNVSNEKMLENVSHTI